MKKLILHIGAGKCGSSTIQSILGRNFSSPSGKKNKVGENLKYACLLNNGDILMGPPLERTQDQSFSNYVSSNISLNDSAKILSQLEKLNDTVSENDSVIISNEGWANGLTPEFEGALNKFSAPLDILLVIRPPVEWMNSSWWQWGVWTDQTLENWIKHQTPAVNYYVQLQKWNSLKHIEKFRVAEISEGLTDVLAEFLDVDPEALKIEKNVNVATNFSLLRHLIIHKEKYGRKTHDPQIEFKLNRILNLPNNPPPFIIPHHLSTVIIENSISSSKNILQKIQSDKRQIPDQVIEKYINPSIYEEKTVADLSKVLAATEDDQLIGELLNHILTPKNPT